MIAVVLKSGNKLIGNLYPGKRNRESLKLGYVFDRRYWHRGYAAESCAACIQKAFVRGIHKIYAERDPQNTPSWRLRSAWAFKKRRIFGKTCIFGRMQRAHPFGRTPLIIPY